MAPVICAGIISQSAAPARAADSWSNKGNYPIAQLTTQELTAQDQTRQPENTLVNLPPIKSEKSFNEGRGLTSAEIKYNSSLGLLGDVMIAHMLGESWAVALEGEGGAKQMRFLATLGYEFARTHGVKVTGEYLQQLIDFKFVTGDEEQRIGQAGVGVGYYYKVEKGILDKIGVTVSYSKAEDKDLGPKSYYIDTATLYELWNNNRNIAGAENIK